MKSQRPFQNFSFGTATDNQYGLGGRRFSIRAVKRVLPSLCFCISAILWYSCVGASAAITINADGSGKIAVEYRVSDLADSLGKLDGNERWQTVPVGRADFERSVRRIPGMRIASFSTKAHVPNGSGGADMVNTVTLEFDEMNALIAFLDPAGKSASFSAEKGGGRLNLVFLEQGVHASPELIALLRELSAAYQMRVSVNAPRAASMVLTDGAGTPIPPQSPIPAQMASKGKTVSFSIGTGDLLTLPSGLGLHIAW